MGIDAVASDRRFKAAVFEVGLPGMSVHLRTAPIPFAADIRKRLGPQLDSALSLIEPLDAFTTWDLSRRSRCCFSRRTSIRV